ncbi:MAG: ATP-grasp domain-containing protein, partial [Pseudomonadota bacterium]|nr:ATP-grasp domain-containing protein [Pseudomonadota bacterium]
MKAQHIDRLWHATVFDSKSLAMAAEEVPYPCVVKPREGVASEQVYLAKNARELDNYCTSVWYKQPGQALLIEPYLEGNLYTLETLGDGQQLQVLGGFRVSLSSPPSFVELQAHWGVGVTAEQQEIVVQQISQFGIGFGACHTEFVMTAEGPRLIEINYRSIGDRRDALMQEALGINYFEMVLRLHMGEPLQPFSSTSRAAAIHYFTSSREGLIAHAPEAFSCNETEVSLRYEPLRKSGEQLALCLSNRDYLGVMCGRGPDAALLGEVMERHSASLNWEIHQ